MCFFFCFCFLFFLGGGVGRGCICKNKGVDSVITTSLIRIFKPLVIVSDWAERIVSDLVGNPEDRLSRDEAQIPGWFHFQLKLHSYKPFSKMTPRFDLNRRCISVSLEWKRITYY